jgi:hypothetical protein
MTDILAIDPGTTKSGWVFLQDGNPIDHGWFDNEKIFTLLKMYQCVVLIEDVGHYGMPVGKDVFQTVRYIGEFKAIAEQVCSLEVVLIKRSEVKLHLCNSPRANDSTVRQAIIDKFGGDRVAIGGKKCIVCKGKGWAGVGRPPCLECNETGYETPPGPLKGISGHVWAALGVGLTHHDSLVDPGEMPM